MSSLNFSSLALIPLILQSEIAECGLASMAMAMAMVAGYPAHHLDMPT